MKEEDATVLAKLVHHYVCSNACVTHATLLVPSLLTGPATKVPKTTTPHLSGPLRLCHNDAVVAFLGILPDLDNVQPRLFQKCVPLVL